MTNPQDRWTVLLAGRLITNSAKKGRLSRLRHRMLDRHKIEMVREWTTGDGNTVVVFSGGPRPHQFEGLLVELGMAEVAMVEIGGEPNAVVGGNG